MFIVLDIYVIPAFRGSIVVKGVPCVTKAWRRHGQEYSLRAHVVHVYNIFHTGNNPDFQGVGYAKHGVSNSR